MRLELYNPYYSMKYFRLIAVLIPCFFLACGGNQSSESPVVSIFKRSEMHSNYPGFKEHTLSDSLRYFLTDSTVLKDSRISDFYRSQDYKIVWTKDIFESPRLDTLLSYIERSRDHGLSTGYFSGKLMLSLRDSLRSRAFGREMEKVYSAMRQLEYLASKTFIDYTTGLKYGFVHPQKIMPNDYFIGIQLPDSAHYIEAFASLKKDPENFLILSQPADSAYLRLQAVLNAYESFLNTSFDSIPCSKNMKNYVLEQKNDIFPLIAKRLMISGELPESAHADSIYASLTPELLEAVNLFRTNNSYPEDKEIGEATIQSLNRPFSYYYRTIQANLERARWKRVTPASDKYVQVNVAAFILQAIEPGYDPIKMNVCAGIPYRNQTPLLESEISYINLNPKWNVPASIVEKEIYWSVKRDSNYLKKQRMKIITRGGQVVDPSEVDWNTVNPKKFPYLIRQDSGDGNSLGRIKFMFDNPFSVYLHDTPMKSRFAYRNRGVSHGCVRIQRPMDFAFFCLSDKDSTYFDRLRYSIDLPPISTGGKDLLKKNQLKKVEDVVYLKKKVPLTIDYYTAYVLPDGKFYFADDVYGFDKKIRKALMID